MDVNRLYCSQMWVVFLVHKCKSYSWFTGASPILSSQIWDLLWFKDVSSTQGCRSKSFLFVAHRCKSYSRFTDVSNLVNSSLLWILLIAAEVRPFFMVHRCEILFMVHKCDLYLWLQTCELYSGVVVFLIHRCDSYSWFTDCPFQGHQDRSFLKITDMWALFTVMKCNTSFLSQVTPIMHVPKIEPGTGGVDGNGMNGGGGGNGEVETITVAPHQVIMAGSNGEQQVLQVISIKDASTLKALTAVSVSNEIKSDEPQTITGDQ